MPLLKGRLYPPVKPLSRKNISPSETVYIIAHTDEQFLSKEEYEKRLALYEEPVWTCQCTGAIKLTHLEALESEKKVFNVLKEDFPSVFEKVVLEIVHHNTIALEQLIDEAYRKLHESLVVGESVVLKVSSAGKQIRGSVLKVEDTHSEKKSDKNEAADDGESVKRTPPKLLPHSYSIKIDGEDRAINGIPSTDLQRMTKVPKKDLLKLFIRAHAVRASTHPNSPWVVSADLAQKHSLQNKFASFLITGAKANGKENSESHPLKRKRSVSSSDQKPAKKLKKDSVDDKKKSDGSNDKQILPKSDSAKKAPPTTSKSPSASTAKKSLWPTKTDSKTSVKASKEANDKKSIESNVTSGVHDVSDDEDISLAAVKASIQQNGGHDSGNKKSKEERKSVSEDSLSLQKKKKNKDNNVDSSKNKSSSKSKSSKESYKKSSPKKDMQLMLYRLSESKSPDKKMKQVTLYQLVNKKAEDKSSTTTPTKSKKNKGDDSPKYSLVKKTPSKVKSPKEDDDSVKYSLVKKTPGKSPASTNKNQKTPVKSEGVGKKPIDSGVQKLTTPRKPPQPIVVIRLVKAKKEGNKIKIAQLVARCAKELSEKQIKAVPADVIDEVTRKFEVVQEKRKIEKMGPEEKEAYLLKKKEEMRQRVKENMKKKWEESKKRFEDTELELKPLPMPKIITTPDGIPNELFGEVVMITEFIHCYSKLLMPEDKEAFTAELLMRALVSGKEGFPYIARIICVLLQTLLQDQLAEDYKELMVSLSQLPINEYTCTELLRLCLRKKDTSMDDETASQTSDNTDASTSDEMEIPEGLIEQLESCEYHELDVEVKIRILIGLCHRVMGTYSLQEYMEEKQQDAAELWRKRIAEQKEQNDIKKLNKQNKRDKQDNPDKQDNGDNKSNQPASDNGAKGSLTINSFYGVSSTAAAAATADTAAAAADPAVAEDEDMISILKSRRQNAAKLAEERKQKDEERRLCKEKEQQEYRNQKDKESAEKQFKVGIQLAKNVFRLTPLGTDRHHNRYWVFYSSPGRIYVEKGWAPQEIDYCTQTGTSSADLSDPETSDEESDDASQSGAQEMLSNSVVEKTLPHKGQNLWFSLDSVSDIEMLLDGLHPMGARESILRTRLLKEKEDIMKTFGSLLKGEPSKAEKILEDVDIIEGFRTELLDTETRLSRGGLGGVPDLSAWEERLKKANKIPDFAKLLAETKKHTLEKFLHGILSESHNVKTKKVNNDSLEDSANEPEEEVSSKPNGLELWLEALNHCTTYSRLHVLLGLLDSCINWEKSVENVKCRICRKKGVEDDHLLLCDECNQPYHLYCLRPALFEIPIGEWFCASCMPEKLGRRSRAPRVSYGQSDQDSDDNGGRRAKHHEEVEEDEGIADIEHDTECIMCGGNDDLIPCTTCSSVFHIDCHDPPLRRPPRPNTWKCMQCRTGQRILKKMNSSRAKALSKRRNNRQRASDNDCDDDDDYNPAQKKKKSRVEAIKRKRVNRVADLSEESADDTETESPVSQRKNASKNKKQKQTKVSDDDSKTSRKGIPGATKSVQNGGVDKVVVLDIINRLMKHRSSWPFLEPVNADEVPDYYTLIKNPMDLQMMRDKCLSDVYSNPQQFINDFALLIRNAEQYNQEDSAVSKCIQPLEKYFESFLNRHFPRCKYTASRST